MRIALDAVGGDHAPGEIVDGGVAAANEYGLEIALVGPVEVVTAELARRHPMASGVTVVGAPEVITMAEHPASAVKQKPNSSIMVGMKLVKEGKADAFVSAGNTGAMMAGAILGLGRIKGVERPAIGAIIPTPAGVVHLLDAGANADCKPSHLYQFAYMGSLYASSVLGVETPRVALLNVGKEVTKGSRLVQEAHELIGSTDLNYVGSIEATELPSGMADVVVCDGFTGNVVLKMAEGMVDLLMGMLREEFFSRLQYRLAAALLRPAFRKVAHRLDYAEYGGAPLLGVNGVAIVAHGRSDARAIKNAIRVAGDGVRKGIVEAIGDSIA
jgi:glycerol-3-phosphate acyltransferase PlsX